VEEFERQLEVVEEEASRLFESDAIVARVAGRRDASDVAASDEWRALHSAHLEQLRELYK
jgi:hypothetical protein